MLNELFILTSFMENYHNALENVAHFSVITLDFIGIFVILIGTIRSIIYLIFASKLKAKRNVKIDLGQSLALGLEFKMGAEIINTVIARDLNELTLLAFIILLRAILAIIIHWEIKVEKKEAQTKENYEYPNDTPLIKACKSIKDIGKKKEDPISKEEGNE